MMKIYIIYICKQTSTLQFYHLLFSNVNATNKNIKQHFINSTINNHSGNYKTFVTEFLPEIIGHGDFSIAFLV